MLKWIFLFSFPLFCDDFGGLAHQNRGCPLNSICSKEMGLKKALWDELLKNLPKDKILAVSKLEEFRKTSGVLLPVWTISTLQEEPDLIKWNSPCPQHQNPDNKLFQAEVFASDFSTLDKRRFLKEDALLKEADNSIISYKIPNKELPLFLNGKEMVFSMAFDGTYFYLGVDPSGKIRVLNSENLNYSTMDIDCPKDLVSKFDQFSKDLYSGYFCKNIYNSALKKYQTLLFGLTCI